MTKVITAGTCAGFTVTPDLNKDVRCVTVEATSAGQTRRAQARLIRPTGAPLFPFPGIFGDKYVLLKNNSNVKAAIGSNDLLQFENNICARDGLKIGTPGGRVVGTAENGSVCSSVISRNTAEEGRFVITPVEFGSTATVNSNVVGWSGAHTYTASQRSLRITGNSFTFTGGDYNLCKLFIEGGTIYIPAGAKVRIFIDSASRTGSGCPATNSGSLIGNNNVTFQNPGAAENLQIFVYGAGPVEFNNQLTLNGYLHAPNSPVVMKNNATITGGIAAQSVEAMGSLDFFTSSTGGLPGGTTVPVFYRTAWTECARSRATSTDPASGC